MSAALEVLGLSLPYSASIPAVYPGKLPVHQISSRVQCPYFWDLEKVQECIRAAKYLKRLLELDLKPRCV